MASILESLPSPASADGSISGVLNGFGTVTVKVQGFAPGDITGVVNSGKNIAIPNSLALIQGTLVSLSEMAQKLPQNPGDVSAELKAGLELLVSDVTELGGVITPIAGLMGIFEPLLTQFDFLTTTVQRTGTITTNISQNIAGLDLTNIAQQIEMFLKLFDTFPEVAAVSPFKELKAQFETLKAWMTLAPPQLSEHFRVRIQDLAEALPLQLDQTVAFWALRMNAIDALLPALDRANWCVPYTATLDAIGGVNLNAPNGINDLLALLNAQSAQVTNAANTLSQKTMALAKATDQLDGERIAQEMRNSLWDILTAVAPEDPGPIAALLNEVAAGLGGLDLKKFQQELAAADRKVDEALGGMDLGVATPKLQALTGSITETVGTLDAALVQVAATLTNLVDQIKGPLANINLAGMVSQIQAALGSLNNTVSGLVAQVTAIRQQVTSFVQSISQDLDQIDFEAVKTALGNLLNQITAVLNDPSVQNVLDAAQNGIQEIASQLENVSLDPVFDTVIAAINDAKAQVAKIDLSKLNDLLKAALAAALEVIRSVDFTAEISPKLTGELDAVVGITSGLTEPLKAKYEEISGQVDAFDPGAIVAAKIKPPFEALLVELNKIDPAAMLKPIQELYESLLEKLEPLNPTNLLADLSEVHSQLLGALQGLSPSALLAPLNALLAEVTGVLNQLGIQDFITKMTETVGRLNSLIGGLPFGSEMGTLDFLGPLKQFQSTSEAGLANVEQQVNGLLNAIVGAVGTPDMSIIAPAITALQAAITQIESQVNTPVILTRVNQVQVTLNTQDLKGCVTDLTQKWSAQKARLAAITPPPQLTAEYESCKQKLQALSPLVLLAAPATQMARVDAKLDTTQLQLTEYGDTLKGMLNANLAKLEALLPSDATVAGFKKLLRDTLQEQIGNPILEIVKVLRGMLKSFGDLLGQITGIAAKFMAPLQALTVLPATINQIGATLLQATNKLTTFNLDFLADELQGVIDQTIAQLNQLNPATVLAELGTIYQNTLDMVSGLYPEAEIEAMGATYQNLVDKLAGLSPDKVIGDALSAQFAAILELKAKFSLDTIFDALNEVFARLTAQLLDGLKRTEEAFDDLLGALPSASALGGSVSVSIG